MPDRSSVRRWLLADATFREQYSVARALGVHALVEEAVADASDPAMKDRQVERLRFDARRWYVSKLLPQVFGDKVVNEHSKRFRRSD
jgi:hypothetical protein